MDRRDFLKGGLFSVFGAALTWARVVRAEEQPANSDTADGEIVECDLFPLLAPQNLDDAILRRPTEPEPVSLVDKMLAHGCGMSCPSWDICRYYARYEDLPCYELAESWGYFPDNVSWDYSTDTGGAPAVSDPWECSPETCPCSKHLECEAEPSCGISPLRIRETHDSHPTRGGVWRQEGATTGRWITWDIDGSDENGTGTWDDPVATEACAQSIAEVGQLWVCL